MGQEAGIRCMFQALIDSSKTYVVRFECYRHILQHSDRFTFELFDTLLELVRASDDYIDQFSFAKLLSVLSKVLKTLWRNVKREEFATKVSALPENTFVKMLESQYPMGLASAPPQSTIVSLMKLLYLQCLAMDSAKPLLDYFIRFHQNKNAKHDYAALKYLKILNKLLLSNHMRPLHQFDSNLPVTIFQNTIGSGDSEFSDLQKPSFCFLTSAANYSRITVKDGDHLSFYQDKPQLSCHYVMLLYICLLDIEDVQLEPSPMNQLQKHCQNWQPFESTSLIDLQLILLRNFFVSNDALVWQFLALAADSSIIYLRNSSFCSAKTAWLVLMEVFSLYETSVLRRFLLNNIFDSLHSTLIIIKLTKSHSSLSSIPIERLITQFTFLDRLLDSKLQDESKFLSKLRQKFATIIHGVTRVEMAGRGFEFHK
ncbi:MAG: hypothetical protein MHMPM18_001151 [Marteilia pararefringens]